MNLKNSVGCILLLFVQCGLWTSAEEVLELANSHMLSQGEYTRLIRINTKGNKITNVYKRDRKMYLPGFIRQFDYAHHYSNLAVPEKIYWRSNVKTANEY